jgi:antitoxin (DNA-binding transcriptional repressor) of toxin-antitoxin stability system
METRVSATQAARTFSRLVNRVRFRGEAFVVVRGGEVVCRVVPVVPPAQRTVADLVRLLHTAPRPDERFAEDLEKITRKQPAMPRAPWPR